MIWHPVAIAVITLDALALCFALYAALPYIRVLLRWEPESCELRQVALEGATDGASLATRYGMGLFITASLVLLVGISAVLPPLVSGAMCGTGVLSAMGGFGERALAVRGIALSALWMWLTLDGMNRALPRPPAVPLVARWQLLSLPFLGLAALYSVRAIIQLDPQQPVDCCQVVYDSFRSLQDARTTAGMSDAFWLTVTAGGALLLGALALGALRTAARRRTPSCKRHLALLFTAASWVPMATLTHVNVLAAYHYEVLHHHCPWCLFLAEHGAVGYPLFASLLLIGLETLAAFAARRFARRNPDLYAAAGERQRRALIRILVALFVFVTLAAGPALLWRLRHGASILGT